MSSTTGERLYRLLPAVYRQRDAAAGQPLRALLATIEAELDLLEADVAGLYENWFVETCAEWVVPYIGDLLGVRNLVPLENAAGALSQRALVANTLAYRRRKGTAAMLEQLARDVTGWPARAVEFFAALSTTQHLNHRRPTSLATADLRDASALELVDGPFERVTHSAEVRHVDVARGRYDIPNVGLYLWRLQPYELLRATAAAAAGPPDGRYFFSQLGADAPLFNRPRTESQITHLAGEENVPAPLRRRPLHDELEARRAGKLIGSDDAGGYFGDGPVLSVYRDGSAEPVPVDRLHVCHLGEWRRPTTADEVFVDPVLGRLTFAAGATPEQVEVSYAYGFSGDVGGGPYSRQGTVSDWLRRDDARPLWQVGVTRLAPTPDPRLVGTLAEAVAAWNALPPIAGGRVGLIAVMDNRSYEESLTGAGAIVVPAGSLLAIVAADWPGAPAPDLPGGRRRIEGQIVPTNLRPHLRGDLDVRGGASVGSALAGELVLDGLLVEGGLTVLPGNLGQLRLADCTLVPGRSLTVDGRPRQPDQPSVVVDVSNDRLRLQIDRSIVGPLRLPAEMTALEVRDSIVDSPARGGRADVWPALVSAELPALAVTAASPSLLVTIGDEGPHRATLLDRPTSLDEAATLLQIAVRAAHPSLAFANARVIEGPGGRLVVLPGARGVVAFDPDGSDQSAAQLGLDRASARPVMALIGGSLPLYNGLVASAPALAVTIGGEGPLLASLGGSPATLGDARAALEAAIRGAPGGSAAFSDAQVALLGARLLVLPGVPGTAPSFSPTAGDQTTLLELGLESDRPAVAATDAGDHPGPPTTIERATILGLVFVTELPLASETIFGDAPQVERRQVGCVRFCYLPGGARTPRQYRCQPDQEIAARLEEAEQRAAAEGRPLLPGEQEAVRIAIERATIPTFTAARYGQPGYAQLAPGCPEPIRTGAEDEGEIGAFHSLQQAQRLQNLRASLDEYLRFGLEAGVFLVT